MLDGGERGKACFKLSGNRLSILSRVRRVVGSGSVCKLQVERIEFCVWWHAYALARVWLPDLQKRLHSVHKTGK